MRMNVRSVVTSCGVFILLILVFSILSAESSGEEIIVDKG